MPQFKAGDRVRVKATAAELVEYGKPHFLAGMVGEVHSDGDGGSVLVAGWSFPSDMVEPCPDTPPPLLSSPFGPPPPPPFGTIVQGKGRFDGQRGTVFGVSSDGVRPNVYWERDGFEPFMTAGVDFTLRGLSPFFGQRVKIRRESGVDEDDAYIIDTIVGDMSVHYVVALPSRFGTGAAVLRARKDQIQFDA